MPTVRHALSKPGSASHFDPFVKTGRRGAARLRLAIPARVVSLYSTQRCVLLDVSRTGAQIALKKPLDLGEGALLQVHTLDQFASAVRLGNGRNGLEFETPLSDELVIQMRWFGEQIEEREKRELREAVRAWVNGDH